MLIKAMDSQANWLKSGWVTSVSTVASDGHCSCAVLQRVRLYIELNMCICFCHLLLVYMTFMLKLEFPINDVDSRIW